MEPAPFKVTREPATGHPVIELEQQNARNPVIPLRDDITLRDLQALPYRPVADFIDYGKKQRIEQVRRSQQRKHATGLHVIRHRPPRR